MELLTLWMGLGFILAAYSVIANDSVQTLGTWIASSKNVNWKYMWAYASTILLGTIWYAWFNYGGDISYERLNKIPFQEVQWYHAAAPAILLLLTRIGVPVSTSFLVLAAFAAQNVLQSVLMKSIMGYLIAGTVAYILWFTVTALFRNIPVNEEHGKRWRIAQWVSTGLLWWAWLSQDLANIAVFLPRSIPLDMMIGISIIFVAGLAFMLRERGGKIQRLVQNKHNTKFVRSATAIDFVYFLILLYFKELNDIPMSTTWVFVGLLAGRELAIRTVKREKVTKVFPIVAGDFSKLMLGLLVSVAIVLLVGIIK
jgi:hypothetical protein